MLDMGLGCPTCPFVALNSLIAMSVEHSQKSM